jgi:hypothetical protein
MATSLMAFLDALDNDPRIARSKLKFGHSAGLVFPAFAIFSECGRVLQLNARLSTWHNCELTAALDWAGPRTPFLNGWSGK